MLLIGEKKKRTFCHAIATAEYLESHIDFLFEFDSKNPDSDYFGKRENVVSELKEIRRMLHEITTDLKEL